MRNFHGIATERGICFLIPKAAGLCINLQFCTVKSYKVDNSWVDGESFVLNSPVRLNPGEFVELKTCTCQLKNPQFPDVEHTTSAMSLGI